MQEVFEKIIEELEGKRLIYFLTIANTGDEKLDCAYEHVGDALDKAIEIVKKEAEKLGTDTNVGSNGWIPCSERLPEPIRPVLVTLRNWMNDKYFVRVGRFHTDHWKTDEGIVENSVVLAWQPLPQPYQPKGE